MNATMEEDKIRGIYNRTAREYENHVTPCKMCQYMILLHELELKGDEKVLELGSGPGQLSIEIAKRLKTGGVTGLDISESMVRIATEKVEREGMKNIRFFVGRIEDFSGEDGSFDVCVNSYLIHWINDANSFLRSIHRVLRVGGKLGIISPSTEWYREIRQAYRKVMARYGEHLPRHLLEEPVGLRIYTEEELHDLLVSAGFEISKSIAFRFREAIPIEECFRRIAAKSGEEYLSFLPEEISRNIREEIMEEIVQVADNLNTTESGYIIIASRCENEI